MYVFLVGLVGWDKLFIRLFIVIHNYVYINNNVLSAYINLKSINPFSLNTYSIKAKTFNII